MPKTLNMADMRGRSDEDLAEFIRTSTKELLETRFQNFTNRLNDTSKIRKARRDLARALTIRSERSAKKTATAAPTATPGTTPQDKAQ